MFRFSGGSFSGRQGSLKQIAAIDKDTFRRLYTEYVSLLREELLPQVLGSLAPFLTNKLFHRQA